MPRYGRSRRRVAPRDADVQAALGAAPLRQEMTLDDAIIAFLDKDPTGLTRR